jgi:membrane protease YdiL (CAAX protease family)
MPGRLASMSGSGSPFADYSLLPKDKTFGQLFPAFALPYFAYVGLGALPHRLVAAEVSGSLRLLAVAALLWMFRGRYRLGPPLTARLLCIALGDGLAATALWILVLRFSLALPWWRGYLTDSQASAPAPLLWCLHAAGSILLVPIFEELFCRAYLSELLYRLPGANGGFSARVAQRWDHFPEPIPGPPLSALSVLGSAGFFALGHDPSAWAAAALYFLFTTWVYAKTRSFRVCVLIHAVANLVIAVLVWWRPEMRFLW